MTQYKFDKLSEYLKELKASHNTAQNMMLDLLKEDSKNILKDADFYSIMTHCDTILNYVCKNFKFKDFDKDETFIKMTIELYQNAKYSIESLEKNDKISETACVMFFDSILEHVDNIRDLTV